MSSAAGSALTPISWIVRPLTLTRPSAISFSAARREAIPAWERIFWSRITARSLSQEACPERDQLPGIRSGGRAVDLGMRDQVAQQQMHVRTLAAQVVIQERRLRRRDDRVVVA